MSYIPSVVFGSPIPIYTAVMSASSYTSHVLAIVTGFAKTDAIKRVINEGKDHMKQNDPFPYSTDVIVAFLNNEHDLWESDDGEFCIQIQKSHICSTFSLTT